jgi:hypothetical protein
MVCQIISLISQCQKIVIASPGLSGRGDLSILYEIASLRSQ